MKNLLRPASFSPRAARFRLITVAVADVALVLTGLRGLAAAPQSSEPHAYALTGAFHGTHDPSIIKEGGTFYVFATGTAFAPAVPALVGDSIETGAAAATSQSVAPDPLAPPAIAGGRPIGQLPIRCSTDLQAWKPCAYVFAQIPDWIKEASPATKDLWAPDISFFDGVYHLYYAYSTFGENASGIALATNKTLDAASPAYKWVDQGLVLKSTPTDDFNAIDPNLIIDERGQSWLSFGSFWSGIKMRRLDRTTGKLSTQDTKLYSLATKARPAPSSPTKPSLPLNWQAIEAPFVIHQGRYYYLFVSWDLCCRGAQSTYRGMVGRSRNITGPYVDRDGVPMMKGGGSPVLMSNSKWAGPGGQSLLKLNDGFIIAFHAYDSKTGRPALQISTLGWKDGWPSASLEGDGR